MDSASKPNAIESFIRRWEVAEASERANAPLFLTELCDLITQHC